MATEKLLHTLKLCEKRGIIEGVKLILRLFNHVVRQALSKGGTWEDPLVIGNFGIKTEFVFCLMLFPRLICVSLLRMLALFLSSLFVF